MEAYLIGVLPILSSGIKFFVTDKVCDSLMGTVDCSVWLDLLSTLWQYGLWCFQMGGTKLERFLPKNHHMYSIEIIEF